MVNKEVEEMNNMAENKYRCKNCLVGYQNKPEDGQKCKHCGLTLVVELVPGE